MTSEEIHLNAALIEAGIETDLGEYIVQIGGGLSRAGSAVRVVRLAEILAANA